MKPFKAGIIFAILLGWADTGACEEHGVVLGKTVPEVATKQQESEIRKLIEQLAFVPMPMPQGPPVPKPVHERTGANPFEEAGNDSDPFEEEVVPPAIAKENLRRARTCRSAFYQLLAFKGLAIPFMAEHLDDGRPSLDFNGHWKGRGVGDACYWNIRELLQDRPPDYSSYSYFRTGRDGGNHVRPYWIYPGILPKEGLRAWLVENAALSYQEKQIKCLSWFVAEEKKIGVDSPASYFKDILPLEIRILERRSQLGEDVKAELKRFRKIQKNKDASAVPPELLPPPVKDGK